MDKDRPHGSNLRIGRVSEPLACYSITKTVKLRRNVLATNSVASILMDSWNYLRKTGEIKLLSFCIMPDHYHLLFVPAGDSTLSTLMERTNKFTAREINKSLGQLGQFWDDGFHDHRCRNDKEIEELSVYIEHNPIRAGFVRIAEDWPYSSAYAGNSWLLDRFWYAQAR